MPPLLFSGITKCFPLQWCEWFRAVEREEGLRFLVIIHARPANIVDWLAMRTVGRWMQNQNWKSVVDRVVQLSGGHAPEGVQTATATLDTAEAEAVERWIDSLVTQRKCETNAETIRTTAVESTL